MTSHARRPPRRCPMLPSRPRRQGTKGPRLRRPLGFNRTRPPWFRGGSSASGPGHLGRLGGPVPTFLGDSDGLAPIGNWPRGAPGTSAPCPLAQLGALVPWRVGRSPARGPWRQVTEGRREPMSQVRAAGKRTRATWSDGRGGPRRLLARARGLTGYQGVRAAKVGRAPGRLGPLRPSGH
jgi:hypothetical protein